LALRAYGLLDDNGAVLTLLASELASVLYAVEYNHKELQVYLVSIAQHRVCDSSKINDRAWG
jgi:hypothetical protein